MTIFISNFLDARSDLETGDAGAVSRFFHNHIVGTALTSIGSLIQKLQSPAALIVQKQSMLLKDIEEPEAETTSLWTMACSPV